MSIVSGLNAAWMWKCQADLSAFQRATSRVAQTQDDVLRAILGGNQDTWFGRRHSFRAIRTARDYQERVPLSTWDDYRQPIERIAAGEPNVLTQDPVVLLEPTSGSSGAEKLIPYTASLRRQFQRGIASWIGDLFRRRPAVRHGRAYWSISPLFGPRRRTSRGLAIGFDDDASYLGTLERWALQRLLVMQAAAARIENIDAFRYCTLLRLLRADDLALVSIWNPTFLTSLLASLEGWCEQLCDDIGRGSLRGAPGLPAKLSRTLRGRAAPRRASELRSIFRQPGPLAAKLRSAWPRLTLISCWTDAAAALAVGELKALFPDVEIQPKGLLATEGFVSFPLCELPAAALSLRSHFFEFVPAPSPEAPTEERARPPALLAHELDRGGTYEVVLTTAGGLYRYQLRDQVEVAGFLRQCPLLRFVGRTDQTSDLVGEKLHESHVRTVLDRALQRQGVRPRFAVLAPVTGTRTGYRLYVQPTAEGEALDGAELAREVEAGLAENPHYRYARALGQLAALELSFLDARGESGWRVVERWHVTAGHRPGDVKPMSLLVGQHWPAAFRHLERPALPAEVDTRAERSPIPGAAR